MPGSVVSLREGVGSRKAIAMLTIEVREVEQPEHFQHMPPAPYELARCWPMRHKVAVSLACYAITERYRVGQMFEVPRAGDDKVYLRVGEKLLVAQLTNRDPSSFRSDAVAVLCVDKALNVVAATGDAHGDWGPLFSVVEAREAESATTEGWGGFKVPFALHADNYANTLHVLWREGEVLSAADTDPARWCPRWASVQNWVLAPRARNVLVCTPSAWSDLRVRPLGPPGPRQRHVGAVTA